MNTKTFISPSKWFQFEQPTDWIYEDEEEGTYLFYRVFGLESTLFLCSFTIDFGSDNDEKVKKEIELCKNSLASIHLLND
jgi:hypothetical protein